MSVLHTSEDPARVALRAVLNETIRHDRFPLLRSFVRGHPTQQAVINRLLIDRRYLAKAECVGKDGKRYTRIAVTVPGIYETEDELGHNEQESLAVTLNELKHLVDQYRIFQSLAQISDIHQQFGFRSTLPAFSRWLTLLCSPRLLLEPASATDPVGFYGQSGVWGTPDPKTGFFERLLFWSHFPPERLPPRAPRQVQLLPDDTLRVEDEPPGQVSIYRGPTRLQVVNSGLGSAVIKTLVKNAGRGVYVLDLQAAAADLVNLESLDEGDDLMLEYLAKWSINPHSLDLKPEETRRLRASCRRLALYRSMPQSTASLPKWARQPQESAQTLEEDLRAQLVTGRLPADFPPIKNAMRVVNRALREALAPKPLSDFRARFSGTEELMYRL
jgi:hypothetical protein